MFNDLPLNRVVAGDSVSVMQDMPSASVDLVFADPPYFLQLNSDLTRPDQSAVNGVNEKWDEFDDFAHYDSFTEQWLTGAKRIMKDNASLWVIGSYHNIYRIGKILQDNGFWLINDVIWVKSNPMPNFRGTRFTNAHEILLWAVKSPKAKYHFNYQSLKSMNDDTQMRSDWYLPICTGGERMKDEAGKKAHPTQKPESLLYRIINACSEPGHIVFDPFAGTGTSLAVAKKLGRNYIGVEQRQDYIDVAQKRLADITPLEPKMNHYMKGVARNNQIRIPFGNLLESGLLQAGEDLFSNDKRFVAKIYADASIESGAHRGSIHKIGATLQGLPSCNGWTYWHVERDGKSIPINDLRAKLYPAKAPVGLPPRNPLLAAPPDFKVEAEDSHVFNTNISLENWQESDTKTVSLKKKSHKKPHKKLLLNDNADAMNIINMMR